MLNLVRKPAPTPLDRRAAAIKMVEVHQLLGKETPGWVTAVAEDDAAA